MNEVIQLPEFWVAVAFVIFIAVLYRPASRILTSMLDQRIERIRDELDEAQRLRKEAQAALASYQRRQREAIQEAEQIVEHAREESERLKAHATAELEELIKRREQQAAEKIAQAETAAIAEIRDKAVALAISAAGQILSEKLSGKAGDEVVASAIKTLPEKLH